jgi:hypothetical protein
MTPEQIETLRKMADEQERDARCKRNYAAEPRVREKPRLLNEADKHADQADTLRSALALAEQARAMEGWEAVTYLRGDTIATRQGDGQWYIEDETRFQYLGYEGVWAGFESREVFADKESAITAANAAMKAGEASTAEESSADRKQA